MPQRQSILVDGYNLIGATRGLKAHDLERAREALLDKMAAYVRARGHEVVVVFDGADLPVDYYPRKGRAGVRVVFSEPGEKADWVLVTEARRRQGRCVVVTNDREVRKGCEEAGALTLGCEEFEGFVRRALGARGQKPGLPDQGPASAGPSAPAPDEDLHVWERFARGVRPLKDHGRRSFARRDQVATQPIPAEDDAAALLASLLEVPDEVAEERAAQGLGREPEDSRGSREARRRRNVLDDL